MVRVLKENNVNLAYIPEVLIKMFYGGTSTSNVGSYMTSILEAHKALRNNGVVLAWWVIFLRTMRVMKQFIRSKWKN